MKREQRWKQTNSARIPAKVRTISVHCSSSAGRTASRDTVVMHSIIEQHRAGILALAERHGITDVRVFGSMARGDADDSGDVDLLVSLPPDRTGLALGALLMDVRDLLQRRVEVVTEKSLHPALRERVLNEAQPL